MKKLRLRSWLGMIGLGGLLVVMAGCAGLGGGGAHAIGEIHLFGLPTAINIPGTTQPGGIGVRIYASEVGGSRGVPIRSGRLDVLMFDQPAEGLDAKSKEPLKTWSFQAADLGAYSAMTMMGLCYTLELRWDQTRPQGKVISVVVRYTGKGKTPVYSPPTVIGVGIR